MPSERKRQLWFALTRVALGVLLLVAGPQVTALAVDADKPVQPKPNATIKGVALLPDGKSGVAGADVHLLARSGGAYTLPVKTRKTTTDANGAFRFPDVPAGKYKLWAETAKLTSLKKKLGGLPVEVDGQGEVTVAPLNLHQGCNYRVVIRSKETGKPLPSGRVWFGWTDIDRRYQADENGVVEIGGLAVDDWYFVVAADGHGIEYKKLPEQSLGSTTELEFDLPPGGTLVGTVRTEEGEPVPGATVGVSEANAGMVPNFGRMKTDQEGRFEFNNLPAGVEVRVGASKQDHSRASVNLAIPKGAGITTKNLICQPRPYGGDCIVRVIDVEGNPIAGVKLRNDGSSTADHRDATTDDQGRARLSHMYSNHRGSRVFARAPGYITQVVNVEPGTKEEPTPVEVTMLRGKLLRGRVVDPDGNPAAKVRVYYNEGEHPWTLGGRVETDAEGNFEIDGLPEQSTLTVYTPKQYAPINDLAVTAGKDDPITITMVLAAIVRIRATDMNTGKSIPEFNVRVRNSPDRQRDEPWGSFSTSYSEEGINVLGEQKEFRMEALQEGTPLQAIVSAKGYLAETLPRVIAVRSDSAELIDVPLQPDSPDNYETIGGRILNPDGKPVGGAIVKLLVGTVAPLSAPAIAAGRRPDQWRFYHWDLIKRGDIKRAPQCLQLLSTSTDTQGRFRFDNVRKSGDWVELLHVAGGVAPARYPDLRKTHKGSLADLELSAQLASSIKLFVNPKKWPKAHAVRLQRPGYTEAPDCIEFPFSSETKIIDPESLLVEFAELPAGQYQVVVEGKSIPVGNNGFRTVNLGSYSVDLPAGEDMVGDL